VFHTATALAGKLDAVSLAAHTIALNAASVTYMVPLGERIGGGGVGGQGPPGRKTEARRSGGVGGWG